MTRRSNGEGTVYQDKNGVWRGAIRLPTGKRAYREAATRAKLVKKLDEVKSGGNPSRETFGAFLDRWLAHVKPKVRGNTYVGYESIVRNHIKPRFGDTRLAALRAEHCEGMLARVLASGRSLRTAAAVRAVAFMALDVAARWEVIDTNPFRKAERPPRRQKRTIAEPMTLDEALLFITHADSWKDRAFMLLAAHTGARRGEIMAAKWQDIAGQTWHIQRTLQRVSGKLVEFPPKSEAGDRRVTLPQQVVDALKDHRRAQLEMRMKAGPSWVEHDYVFTGAEGQPLQPEYVYDSFLALLKAAGLKKRRFHDLRHSVCSVLLSKGYPLKAVQQFMGHSSAVMTLDVYGHNMPGAEALGAWKVTE